MIRPYPCAPPPNPSSPSGCSTHHPDTRPCPRGTCWCVRVCVRVRFKRRKALLPSALWLLCYAMYIYACTHVHSLSWLDLVQGSLSFSSIPSRSCPEIGRASCWARVSDVVSISVGAGKPRLGETGPLSQGVQARRKALRIRHINGMEVRKKRPRGVK